MLRSALGVGLVGAWVLLGGCGGTAVDSAPAVAAISCEWSQFTTGSVNERGIGAGCSAGGEVQACTTRFCTLRVLADRWPASSEDEYRGGHCTQHCDSASDCGSGFSCCEARPGPFCLRYGESSFHPSGCSELCAKNELGCAEGEICCARLGKICISDKCTGVCTGADG